jgi:hypothetical protein
MLSATTHFNPIRLEAFVRNEVEMEIFVKNESKEVLWIEADINIPEAISLAPDRTLSRGRTRIGIAYPNEKISKKIKIFAGAGSYPDTYIIRITLYGYGKDGAISTRLDLKSELRCEKSEKI